MNTGHAAGSWSLSSLASASSASGPNTSGEKPSHMSAKQAGQRPGSSGSEARERERSRTAHPCGGRDDGVTARHSSSMMLNISESRQPSRINAVWR